MLGGSIKSSLGLGILLSKGIGDTIRVSLTDSSIQGESKGVCCFESYLDYANHGGRCCVLPYLWKERARG
ncbi:MAG: flavodoxin-dependent (E)-4-hydroxy-3-methylbut-2-enyl-diphosphate synthase [Actinomycetota bacterium]|nr:flavodoxin-dependent (E)-4-hydroxy-3-methylbut-2-enyl-diphosphate synthase [Actinomycetota bacterium]